MTEERTDEPSPDPERPMPCPKCGAPMRPVETKPAPVLGEMGFKVETMQCEDCPYREPRLV